MEKARKIAIKNKTGDSVLHVKMALELLSGRGSAEMTTARKDHFGPQRLIALLITMLNFNLEV